MTDPIGPACLCHGHPAPLHPNQTALVRETGRETALALLAAMGEGGGDRSRGSDRARGLEAEDCRPPPAPLDRGRGGHGPDPPHRPRRMVADAGGRQPRPRAAARPCPACPSACMSARGPDEKDAARRAPALPLPPRGWGVTAHALGPQRPDTPGFGEFDDLRRTGEALGKTGAGFLGINPNPRLASPTEGTLASPYSASHPRPPPGKPVPLADRAGVATGPLVDYAREIPAKRAALRAAYDTFRRYPASTRGPRQEGDDLTRFAAHQALSDRYGRSGPTGPPICKPRRGQGPRPRTRDPLPRGLQWMAHRQLTDNPSGTDRPHDSTPEDGDPAPTQLMAST